MSGAPLRYSVVVPTTGRASLEELLAALPVTDGPEEVVVVDDRLRAVEELAVPRGEQVVRVLRSGGLGPAGARNVGWCAARTPWVVFLDDDVVPEPDWGAALRADLTELPDDVAGCQGWIIVPLPRDRAPDDLERGTAGLARAWWITADMAYRRDVLDDVGGFDERFPRAYREDADLALRVQERGYHLRQGTRRTRHPVRPAGFFASVRAQAGNADNAVLRRKYGAAWRHRIGEGPGRTVRHAATTGAALAVAGGLLRARWRPAAVAGSAVWLALTGEFFWRRVAPGPRTPGEVIRMAVTSAVIPPVACWHRALGEVRTSRDRSAFADASRPESDARHRLATPSRPPVLAQEEPR